MDCPCCVSVRALFNLPSVDVVGSVCRVCEEYEVPEILLTNPSAAQFREYIDSKRTLAPK
jgi:hypothetical protein